MLLVRDLSELGSVRDSGLAEMSDRYGNDVQIENRTFGEAFQRLSMSVLCRIVSSSGCIALSNATRKTGGSALPVGVGQNSIIGATCFFT
jgi:hypothetical protein